MVNSLRQEPGNVNRPVKHCSIRVAEKLSAHCITLLGIIDQATTFVVGLVIIPLFPTTRATEELPEVP